MELESSLPCSQLSLSVDPIVSQLNPVHRLTFCALTEHQTTGVLRSRGMVPRILDLGTRWRWVVSFTPGRFTPQLKSPCCPLDRRLCGPQSRPGRGGEERNSQPLSGLEPPIMQPVTQRYTAELSRLRMRFCNIHFNIILHLRPGLPSGHFGAPHYVIISFLCWKFQIFSSEGCS
jgi:hypothetical protein